MPAVANRTRNLSTQLGDVGDPTTEVVTTVSLDGRVNGRAVDEQFTQRLTLVANDDTYGVSGRQRATRTRQTTEIVEQQRDHGPVRRVGGPVLLGAGLLAAASLSTARRRDAIALGPVERRWLSYREDRDRYDEWIHTATLPSDTDALPRVRAATLGDLVDIAIDVDAAVLESSAGGRFVVVHDGHQYVYDAPTPVDASGAGPTDADGEDRTDLVVAETRSDTEEQ